MNNIASQDIDDHSRTIIHIDFDCFYAQIEMNKNPSLRGVPLGVYQKNMLVTTNYVARNCGVSKCGSLKQALEVCPNLVLVNGEDLYEYRKVSHQITTYLQKFSPLVERLGLDENYVDISELVRSEIRANCYITGYIFNGTNVCSCGCYERLAIGSRIAQELREGIFKEFNLTSCAGIAHNKLLAKLIGSTHKPNQQTTILPNAAFEFMLSLNDVSKIPGIGVSTAEKLRGLNIHTIEQLHSSNLDILHLALTREKAKVILDLSYGYDTSPVKPSSKPQTIGLEDSFRNIDLENEINDKFRQLLKRLMILVTEDGRIPTTIKVTIRKSVDNNTIAHRETRQCSISPSLFKIENNNIKLTEQSEMKLLATIRRLFNKLINTKQSNQIKLLGLSFTKFQDPITGKSSIASYFIKDVSVQSITNIDNVAANNDTTCNSSILSHSCSTVEDSEGELSPSPKKSKLDSFVTNHQYLIDSEMSSPSKLSVADLRLSCREDDSMEGCSTNANKNVVCPPDIVEDVFQSLPVQIQEELWNAWKRDKETVIQPITKKFRSTTLLNYFVKK